MAVLNPKQIEYIKSIQPDFEFRVRKLQPSLDIASDEDLFKAEPNVNPKPLVRQGSLQTEKGRHGTKRSEPSAPFTTRQSISDASLVQPTSLPVEDRRLLARAKWLLKRLLMESEEDEFNETTKYSKITDELDENDELLELKRFNRKGHEVSSHALLIFLSAKELNIDNLLTNLLNDKADRKEVFFVLNILSFLKDGKTCPSAR
jgi:hypothetical protein